MNEKNIQQEIKDFCQYHTHRDENLFIKKLREGCLSENMIIVVINAISDTCKYCLDSDNSCQCWNDE